MATINKGKKKKQEVHGKKKEVFDEVYNTSDWRKLRKQKLMDQPLCEVCLSKGIIKQAQTVHHIIPILQKIELAFTYSNLKSLCNKCHSEIHNEMHSKNK